MNLLVVDDSLKDRCLLKGLLAESALSVTASFAGSVVEVEQLLQEQRFDVILLSDDTRQWDALELLLTVRNQTVEHQSAIIMMTLIEDEQRIMGYVKSGAHDVVMKADLSDGHLRRAIISSSARCELELKLRQSYDRVKYLAEHDALTNIPNRYVFDMRLRICTEQSKLRQTCVALILLNVDRFKFINDTYGHEMGDQILVELTSRMKQLMKPNEEVFRIGGDEFAVLLSDLKYAHINGFHQRLMTVLEEPFMVKDTPVRLTVSAGVAYTPQNCDGAEQLLRCADIAMYRAKKQGYNQICFVDDDAQLQFQRRFVVEQELQQAINKNEFILHYQPVMSARQHHLLSCEALVRWQHPQKGLVYPDYFIDIAEETGQVVEIGKCVIEQACQQMAAWQAQEPVNIVMALNISPQQLYDKNLVDFFDSKLLQYGLHPSQFEIEITETALLKNTSVLLNNLAQFVERGFSLALDDFGTGFSSIQHLQSFPISTVKIDRSLMPSSTSSQRSLSLLNGLVAMLKSMGLSMVAEGIEDKQNATLCRELGVQRLQGYYFSKPVSAEEFEGRFIFAHLMEQCAV